VVGVEVSLGLAFLASASDGVAATLSSFVAMPSLDSEAFAILAVSVKHHNVKGQRTLGWMRPVVIFKEQVKILDTPNHSPLRRQRVALTCQRSQAWQPGWRNGHSAVLLQVQLLYSNSKRYDLNLTLKGCVYAFCLCSEAGR